MGDCPVTDARPLRIVDARPALGIGTRIGAYEITARLGAGGMGEVYRAADPRLGRDVAIKVLREGGHARLLREAQAMAKLSHPNVVVVYDVGLVEDRVFVAMELVEGDTLRGWLAARPRRPREILDAYLRAGRGLAAAHAAGLVHRDFKPDNVLVGRDGRVCVADFGLAGAAEAAVPAEPADSPRDTGAGAGTPAYMAPEQHAGDPVDARADQFAFAVSLHEALFGEHPFVGETTAAIVESMAAGRLRPARGASRARAILERALAPSPADRYPDMPALLAALARDPRTLWWRALVFASVAGAAALAAMVLTTREPCAQDDAGLAGAWDDDARRAVESAFLATGRAYALDSFEHAAAALDEYGAAWLAMRQDACRATNVRHEQSAELFDLRMACLARRRGELTALTGVLAAADVRTVDGAVEAIARLGRLEECADIERLRGAAPPPAAEIRSEVAALRASLDEIEALERAGRDEQALGPALAAAERARVLGYAPALAEALAVLASVEQAAGDPRSEASYHEAIQAAARVGDDDRLAVLWTALVMDVGHRQGRYRDALALGPTAEAASTSSPSARTATTTRSAG